ncbi:hypothetical protein ACFYSC_17960 [Streptosporangium sp. NPDC004379]|uniref:hypothetical protein n=1 Tax=Streptosporangium sp. NPDC004379 TaxID=3366189 RepID=UPI0036A7F37E
MDERLAPGYYVQVGDLTPRIAQLPARCTTVFDIKDAMAADLDGFTGAGEEPRGAVEDGALIEGDVIVQAGARVEQGARIAGPVLICAGAVIAAPDIIDTGVCAQILTYTGACVTTALGRFAVAPAEAVRPVIHSDLGRQVRTTAVLAAAVLARAGQVDFPYPGGDAFCARLIDRHLAAMQSAGAEITADTTGIRARYGPRGPQAFTMDVATPYGPSLGATVTAMLLAARIPGTSLITNPSIEPEVIETARFLAERGVGIGFDGHGLHVNGTDRIGGGAFTVIGDRIEAATMIMAAAATGGDVHLDGITTAAFPEGLTAALAATGVTVTDDRAGGVHTTLDGPLRGIDVATGAVVCLRGPVRLHATTAAAADIRAVTALLIAALTVDGVSTIRGAYHLRRGYGHLLANFVPLGADVTTVEGP